MLIYVTGLSRNADNLISKTPVWMEAENDQQAARHIVGKVHAKLPTTAESTSYRVTTMSENGVEKTTHIIIRSMKPQANSQ